MQVITDTKNFSSALASIIAVIEKANIKQILNNTLVKVQTDGLSLSVTNADLFIARNISVQVREIGEITVPAKLLSNIVKKISDPEITLNYDEESKQLHVVGQNCKFSLTTLSAEQFPILDIENNKEEVTNFIIASKDLQELLEPTYFAMSSEETRYNLNGVYLHQKDSNKSLAAAAMDGHRLSVASIDLEVEKFGIIIPRKTVEELLKICKQEQIFNVSITDTLIKFINKDITIVSKLVEGKFPDYVPFLPNKHHKCLTISAKLLSGVIDRVSTITSDKFKAIKFHISNNHLETSAYSNIRDSASEVLSFESNADSEISYQGSEVTIGFNPKYLLDVLSFIQNKDAQIFFDNPTSSALIRLKNSEKYHFIVMPVQV